MVKLIAGEIKKCDLGDKKAIGEQLHVMGHRYVETRKN